MVAVMQVVVVMVFKAIICGGCDFLVFGLLVMLLVGDTAVDHIDGSVTASASSPLCTSIQSWRAGISPSLPWLNDVHINIHNYFRKFHLENELSLYSDRIRQKMAESLCDCDTALDNVPQISSSNIYCHSALHC
ncbi:Hypothetical predicted protein [Octopus vulgaris]|uniref:Uncharacterized protein n=1 Tax=Octopus vulgaris TaxID=6645 RepID=A0AA36AKP5_OCTVU|nr:Hypothetical predicted protein [Octopus vulgaris]